MGFVPKAMDALGWKLMKYDEFDLFSNEMVVWAEAGWGQNNLQTPWKAIWVKKREETSVNSGNVLCRLPIFYKHKINIKNVIQKS